MSQLDTDGSYTLVYSDQLSRSLKSWFSLLFVICEFQRKQFAPFGLPLVSSIHGINLFIVNRLNLFDQRHSY